MKPAPFGYYRAHSIEDALVALRENEDAMVIAGGQSLLPMLNLRVAMAEYLVDISCLENLKHYREQSGIFSIGSLVTHSVIEDGAGRGAFNGLLQRVASRLAYRTVRNIGTIGGSLSLNDPAADWPACMLALGASAVIATDSGAREVSMKEFLEDAYTTRLQQGDILISINISARRSCKWGVSKVTRKSGAFADSLAIAVAGCSGQPTRVVLTGTESGAQILTETSKLLDEYPGGCGKKLSNAISQDVAAAHEDADSYQQRCHIHTVTSAIAEAKLW